MQLTAEMIEARKAALTKQADKMQADLNATLGAIQDCSFWLAQVAKPEPDASAAKT